MLRILNLYESVQLTKAKVQKLSLESFNFPEIEADVLRLDAIDEVISGNKWFKLKWHLIQAFENDAKGIATFGGAYSNHLVATAAACQRIGFPCVGFIRGEPSYSPSTSIVQMKALGMQLEYINRQSYKSKEELQLLWTKNYPEYYWVPEGGAGIQGVKGGMEIMELLPENNYSRVFCAIGTGTTMAGLLESSTNHQLICGVPVLKWSEAEMNSLTFLQETAKQNFKLYPGYHEGGYAKWNKNLIDFMNRLFSETGIPTDFVYTGKLFKAVLDLMRKGEIKSGEKIMLVHSGGLQGNRSLPPGTLIY